MRLRVAISTCPNDTFAFAGLLAGAVDRRGLDFALELGDVQALNERLAVRSRLLHVDARMPSTSAASTIESSSSSTITNASRASTESSSSRRCNRSAADRRSMMSSGLGRQLWACAVASLSRGSNTAAARRAPRRYPLATRNSTP